MASSDIVIKSKGNRAALIMSSAALLISGASLGLQACPPVPAPAAAPVKPAEDKPVQAQPVAAVVPSVVPVPVDQPPVVAAPVMANVAPVSP
jgi:hypothetical protein